MRENPTPQPLDESGSEPPKSASEFIAQMVLDRYERELDRRTEADQGVHRAAERLAPAVATFKRGEFKLDGPPSKWVHRVAFAKAAYGRYRASDGPVERTDPVVVEQSWTSWAN